MTGQFESFVDAPKPETRPKYIDFQADHDQHPIRTEDGRLLGAHGGRVPGVRRPRRAVQR